MTCPTGSDGVKALRTLTIGIGLALGLGIGEADGDLTGLFGAM